jgi:sugar diacid utilization regulator
MALASGLQRESATLREHVPRIGVGGTQHLVAGLPESYSQAAVAVRMAQMVKRLGSVVLWDRTGPLGLVARMLDGRDPHPLLPRCVRDLLADPDGRSLLETVETYLRHGGDVRVSAEALHLHRASLYKRLRRVERIAGIDLSCGPERLELHLGLQLWRLGGA